MSNDNRNERCGATDAAVILGIAPKKTAWELAAEKTGRLEPWAGNEATRAGNRLESAILDQAEEDLGSLDRNQLVWAPSAGFPLAAQLDGIVKASGQPVDAKTSGIVGPVFGHWGDEGSDDVPTYYLVQLLIQCYCSNADLAHLYALLGGRGIVAYQVQHDRKISAQIVERCGEWWQKHIVEGIEPDRSEAPALEVVKRLKRVPSKVIDLDDAALALADTWELAKTRKSAALKELDTAQAELLLALGDAEAANLPDGRYLTYLVTNRKGYVAKPSSYRQLRMKD